jgi:hypothetical protein
MRKRETIGSFRMRETGRIEIEPKTVRFCPRNPILEMRDFDFVAIHFPTAKLAIHRM